ncbi:hypothetical protein COBT_001140, partial [Conglomerata obtusa]
MPIYKDQSKITVKSVTNNTLKLIGSVRNIPIIYNESELFLSAYVTDTYPKNPILGKDFILKYPNILISILNNKLKQNRIDIFSTKIQSIRNMSTTEDSLYKEFADSFTTGIDKYKGCNFALHEINTLDNKPIKEYNFR